MEPIGEILKRVRTNQTDKNPVASSSVEPPVNSPGESEEDSPVSDCLICKGAKFVHPLLPSGKPDYSKVVPCQCTRQTSEADLEARFSWAPQFSKQKEMTFENFRKRDNLPLEERENLDRAYNLALEFARSPEGWLVFRGDNGCGKTHLAAAIVNYCYQHKQPALFVVVPDFLDHLRSTFSPESETSYDQLFESVRNAPLLVLDDFGKQTTTPWAQEKLFQVINHRYNAKLPTVITTNLAEEEMDSPILSRFADPTICTAFHILAPDYYSGRRATRRTSRSGPRGR